MKISIMQENLNKALAVVSRVVSSKASLPVLNNLLISTENSLVKLSATNLEIGIIYSIGAKIEEKGSVSVPARLFSELVASLNTDKLQLVAINNNLKIKTTNLESSLNGINPEEFPAIPQIEDKPRFNIRADKLLSVLAEVAFNASIDESRPALAGVLVYLKKDQLVLVATDSYRLAERKINIKNSEEIKAILPIRTAQELIRILSNIEEGGGVNIYLTDTEIMFEIGSIKVISRLIEGKFPNYEQIIPEKSTTQVNVDKAELLNAVKIANLFARESSNAIKISISEKGEINITSSASQVGENSSIIKAKINGHGMDININGRYLVDVLNIISTDKVSLDLSGKLNPCIIRPIDKNKQDTSYTYLIMPLRS
ncbi:MAG: DNA polymerase III subunit beta [bacterium]|nr:DNA polymerase III subunit beta [bacterium]